MPQPEPNGESHAGQRDPLDPLPGEDVDDYIARVARLPGPPPDVEELWEAVADLRDEVRALGTQRFPAGPGLDRDVPPPEPDGEPRSPSELLRAPRERETAQLFAPPLLAEFAAQVPPTPDWVLWGYAARDSATVIGGHAKAGKSHFVAEAAGSVSVGARFLGHETLPGAVVWIDLEQPRDLTARLLTGYCLEQAPVYVQWGALPGFDALRAFCERAKIILVVVDSLARVFELAGVEDENDAAQVGRAVQPLLDFARTAHVALILIHHLRKSGGSEGLDLRGSGALAAAVDILVSFRRYTPDAEDDDTKRTLHAYSRYEETPRRVVIERVDGRYRVVGTPGEVRRRSERDKVLAVLTAEPRSAEAVAAAAGLSESATRTVLRLMAAEPDDQRMVAKAGTGTRGDPFVYSTTGKTARTNNLILRAINPQSEVPAPEREP